MDVPATGCIIKWNMALHSNAVAIDKHSCNSRSIYKEEGVRVSTDELTRVHRDGDRDGEKGGQICDSELEAAMCFGGACGVNSTSEADQDRARRQDAQAPRWQPMQM